MPTKTGKKKSAWSAKDIYDMFVKNYGFTNVKSRAVRKAEADKYTIPYIPEKEIMLTTGRYNTGKISTNVLDSIYNAAKRTNVPIDIALGLAGRESTLGVGRGFKRGQSISGTDLMSNWQQIQPVVYKDSERNRWNETVRKEKSGQPLNEQDYLDRLDFLIKNQEAIESTKALNENPIDNALKLYQSGKYNPGDKRHTQMVEEDAKALMSDPAIQKWLKTKTETQMKCGGRRKAQLGLDIREGGIAIPIANNMFYIKGRKHSAGGVAIGPNNKNGVEVEDKEVVEIIDSNHPSVGRQFKAGGQQQTMRVFSSVPLLRGVSPAELVLQGYNPDDVFKAQEDFKDRNRINDDGTRYQTGGKIAIEGAKTIGGYLPFVGTALDAYELYKNPSWKQAGWTTLGLLSDIFTGGSARAVVKTARNLKNAKEALSIVRGPITNRIYKDAAVDAIKANTKAKKDVIRDATFNVSQNYTQHINDKYEMGGEGKSKSKRSRPVTGVLPYGYTIRNLYAVENPYRKGIKGNIAKMYDSRTLGAGVDVVSGHPELYKKAKSGKMTKKQADETAVIHLRKDDNAIRSNYADVYGKAAADTLSYGPRFLVAQARYQQGNVRKAWQPIHKAMAKGDAKALKKAVLQVTPKDHTYRRKWIEDFKVYKMGGMIYTINGNVRNGLMSARPKAQYGKEVILDKNTKIGADGLIYKWKVNDWYTDGTVHPAYKKINSQSNITNQVKKIRESSITKAKKNLKGFSLDDMAVYTPLDDKETKKIGSLYYEKNDNGQWVTSSNQSSTTTRGGNFVGYGMSRVGINHPNGKYKYHPLTGEKLTEEDIVETSEPSVKGTTKVSPRTSSTPRRGGTKATTSKAATKSTPTLQDNINQITRDAISRSIAPKIDLSKVEMPKFDVSKLGSKETKAAKAKLNTSSTGGGTQSKDERLIPQFKPITTGDWIGLGSNLAGHIASYFANNNLLKKYPMPTKPIMAQAAKLKTRYNINPELSENRETELVNRAAVRRNSQSSNTSLAREQRIANEARNARNKLYGQKENIETQLINQDRLNRQSVMARNVAAYNDWLDKTYVAKSNRMLAKQQNLMSLINGIPTAVNNIIGNIESRRTTNNTIKAIAAANPNVDGRLLGIGDYYVGEKTKKKYDRFGNLID